MKSVLLLNLLIHFKNDLIHIQSLWFLIHQIPKNITDQLSHYLFALSISINLHNPWVKFNNRFNRTLNCIFQPNQNWKYNSNSICHLFMKHGPCSINSMLTHFFSHFMSIISIQRLSHSFQNATFKIKPFIKT